MAESTINENRIKRKSLIPRGLFWLIFSLTAAVALTASQAVLPLRDVRVSYQDENYFYGLEQCQNGCYIFRVHPDSRMADLIYQPLEEEENGRIYLINQFIPLEDGRVWAVREAYKEDWIYEGTEVLLCNFENGSFSPPFLVEEGESVLPLRYLSHSGKEGYEFQLLRLDDSGENYSAFLYYWNPGEKEVFSGKSYRLVKNPLYVTLSQEEILYCADGSGHIYRILPDKDPERLFSNDGSRVSRRNMAYSYRNREAWFYNLDSEKTYGINLTNGEMREIEDSELHGSKFFRYEEPQDLTSITRSFSWLWAAFLKSFLAILISGMVLELFRLLIIRLSGGVFPTSMKITCMVIPMAAVFYFLICIQVVQVFSARFKEQEKSRLYFAAEMLADSVSSEEIENYKEEPYFFYDLAVNRLASIWDGQTVYGIEGGAPFEASGESINGSFYRLTDGEFYLMEPGNLNHIPMEYSYRKNSKEYLEQCAEKEEIIVWEGRDAQMGEELNACAPIKNRNGRVTGAAQVTMSVSSVTDTLADKTLGIAAQIFVFFFVLFLTIILIIIPSLRPLNKMRRAVREFFKGQTRVKIHSWGSQEVAEILQTFQHMAENSTRYFQKIQKVKNAYEPFLPVGMIRLLGKQDIRQVKPGDSAGFDAGILVLKAKDFHQWEKAQTAPEVFETINQSLAVLSAEAEEAEGWIESFDSAGGRIFFKERGQDAVKTAVKLLQEISGQGFSFHGSVCYGRVQLKILGTDQRMESAVFSNVFGISQSLCRLAEDYGAGLFVTETVSRSLSGCVRERKFGRMLLENGRELNITEVYEADSPDQIRLKEQTKTDFEKGVELFFQGSWKEARACFAGVLHQNPRDMAASRYFSQCGLRMETPEKAGSKGYVAVLKEAGNDGDVLAVFS